MEEFVDENENNLKPTDIINGFHVRPGFYRMNGATAFPNAINFTVFSTRATSCELLLFYRKETIPYAVIPFPEHYKIGHVYSMLIFNLNVEMILFKTITMSKLKHLFFTAKKRKQNIWVFC